MESEGGENKKKKDEGRVHETMIELFIVIGSTKGRVWSISWLRLNTGRILIANLRPLQRPYSNGLI